MIETVISLSLYTIQSIFFCYGLVCYFSPLSIVGLFNQHHYIKAENITILIIMLLGLVSILFAITGIYLVYIGDLHIRQYFICFHCAYTVALVELLRNNDLWNTPKTDLTVCISIFWCLLLILSVIM